MRIRAGRLRRRLHLQQTNQTRTASGGYTDVWTTTATVWGSIEPLRGREYFENAQVQGQTTHRIVIRYQSSVDSSYRVVDACDSRVFNIVGGPINPNDRNVLLELMVKEQDT